jgi:hypothetical protein
MSARVSWVCTAGHHWACTKCCPHNKCKAHRNRPITAVGRLWSDSIGGVVVCANGCIAPAASAAAAAATHVCTKQLVFCGSLGMRGRGELSTLATTTHSGCIAVDQGRALAIVLSKTTVFTCELIQRGHYNRTHAYELCITLCIPTVIGEVQAAALVPMGCEVGQKIVIDTDLVIPLPLWKLARIVTFQVTVRKLPPPITNCVGSRYWRMRQLPRPKIGNAVYSETAKTLVPTANASHHFPCEFPIYRSLDNGTTQCCWCNRIYANMNAYIRKCAPDTV